MRFAKILIDWVLNREIKQMIDNYTKVILAVIAVSTSFIKPPLQNA